jgi:hypothetical protein
MFGFVVFFVDFKGALEATVTLCLLQFHILILWILKFQFSV